MSFGDWAFACVLLGVVISLVVRNEQLAEQRRKRSIARRRP